MLKEGIGIMSPRTTSELITTAISGFGSNVHQLGSEYSRESKHELEGHLIIANGLVDIATKCHAAWQARIGQGQEQYSSDDDRCFKKVFARLRDILADIDTRRQAMERALDEHVSGGSQIFTTLLQLQRLLREEWVPVAAASMAFEDMAVEGENEEFMEKFLARTS